MNTKRYKARSIQDAIRRIKEDLGVGALILSTKRLPGNPRNPYTREVFEVEAVAPEDYRPAYKNDPAESTPETSKFVASSANDSTAGSLGTIQAELMSIKDMLALMTSASGLAELLKTQPENCRLFTRLLSAGLSEGRAWSLLQHQRVHSEPCARGHKDALQPLLQTLLAQVDVVDPFAVAGQPMYAAFVGPTGVGKTTTVAKLAAALSLQHKKKVGLISIDNYRIGAVDQLKTYAAIMGLPCIPAFTHQELNQALHKMEGCDVILIDTAGHSHLDNRHMQELSALMGDRLEISSHLVLSAATSRKDMAEAARRFAVLKPHTYVFTKLDETRRPAGIINQALGLKKPISFITNGQKVPEDIVPATKSVLMQLMLN